MESMVYAALGENVKRMNVCVCDCLCVKNMQNLIMLWMRRQDLLKFNNIRYVRDEM